MKIQEKTISCIKMKLITLNKYILGIPTEIGPRILYFASRERPDLNLFNILPDTGIRTSKGFWHIYGGHRLWKSPEEMPGSYCLENKPVDIELRKNSIIINGNPEKKPAIQKQITIRPGLNNTLEIQHTITNRGKQSIELACWALTVMRPKGFAIVPFKTNKQDLGGLLPNRHLILWPYTPLSDTRLIYKNSHIFLRYDPSIPQAVKIGTLTNPAWVAFHTNEMLFVKRFQTFNRKYPDGGCNAEVYTNSEILELETIGPLTLLNPKQSVYYSEYWSIIKSGKLDPRSISIEQKIDSLLK